jgi:hypothetical protein
VQSIELHSFNKTTSGYLARSVTCFDGFRQQKLPLKLYRSTNFCPLAAIRNKQSQLASQMPYYPSNQIVKDQISQGKYYVFSFTFISSAARISSC